MKIILPKEHVGLFDYGDLPLFFLAGPVLGGGDWQYTMCGEIRSQLGERDFLVAIPCRYGQAHFLRNFRVSGKTGVYEHQLDWERHYLHLASTHGCIIFWLPEESKVNPRNDGLSYAMDTRGELGEWRGRLINDHFLRIVIGGEKGFPGLDVIERNFKAAIHPDFQICENMAALVSMAIEKANIK
ncbi:MAG: hypothetical protein LiPW30_248 [Parcubacteria group bacterium LiPW_30]|nr:MAG: hypothetical protein LiPW30_248 [Parcubacteria group bacterium LiPW_30]